MFRLAERAREAQRFDEALREYVWLLDNAPVQSAAYPSQIVTGALAGVAQLAEHHAPAANYRDQFLEKAEHEMRRGILAHDDDYLELCSFSGQDQRALAFVEAVLDDEAVPAKVREVIHWRARDLLIREKRYALFLRTPDNELEEFDRSAREGRDPSYLRMLFLQGFEARVRVGDVPGSERAVVSLLCFNDTEKTRAALTKKLEELGARIVVPPSESLVCPPREEENQEAQGAVQATEAQPRTTCAAREREEFEPRNIRSVIAASDEARLDGEFDTALEEYKWLFAYAERQNPPIVGVMMSHVAWGLSELARKYAPAEAYRDSLLDELEVEMKQGKAHRALMYFRLCMFGKKAQRALSFLEALMTDADIDPSLVSDVGYSAREFLFEQKRFKTFLALPTNSLRSLERRAHESIEKEGDYQRERYLQFLAAYMGTGNEEKSKEVLLMLLCFDDSKKTRAQLAVMLQELHADLDVPSVGEFECAAAGGT